MDEYRKYLLAPGQQSPTVGATGVTLTDGWLVWYGEQNTFPSSIQNQLMTTDEIAQYKAILAQPQVIQDATQEMVVNDLLVGRTKQQILDYIEANWTTIATSKAIVKKIAALLYDVIKRSGW